MLEDSIQGNNVSWHISGPLYVGGVPPGRAQKNIQVQVKICHVKNIKQQKKMGQLESFKGLYL